MNHIERMEVELKELKEKYEKGAEFLNIETECPKFTDEIQRQQLFLQLSYMENYVEVLEARIEYDKDKKEQ